MSCFSLETIQATVTVRLIGDLSDDSISNEREWPLTQISMARHYLTSNISRMVQDRDIITME